MLMKEHWKFKDSGSIYEEKNCDPPGFPNQQPKKDYNSEKEFKKRLTGFNSGQVKKIGFLTL